MSAVEPTAPTPAIDDPAAATGLNQRASPSTDDDPPTWPLIRRFVAQFCTPHVGLAAAGLVLTAAVAAASTSYALLMGWIGQYVESGRLADAWPAPLAIIAATSVRALFFYGQVAATQTFAARVIEDVQKAMHAHILTLDFARMTVEAPGHLVARFTSDVERLRAGLTRAATNLGRDVLTLIGGAAVMLWADWLLAVIVMGVYPLAIQPVLGVGKRLRRASRDAQTQIGRLTAFLDESFAGVQLVKTYRLEAYQTVRADAAFAERRRIETRMARHRAKVEPIMEVAGGLGLAGVIGFAVWRASATGFGFSVLMTFIGAIAVMAPAARSLGALNAFVQQGLAAAARIFELLDEEPRVVASPGAPALRVNEGRVELEGVGFAYAAGAPALEHVSLTLAPGATTALVGPSGGGKSTILNLILRLYDPSSGRILIDGHDIRACDLASVRAAMAFVSQDPVLFEDTIAANIGFGRPGATMEAIRAAAEQAAALDFIEAAPAGFATLVGPRGLSLSGGQRQRIALARAFLKDAPILLLDEATSALDAESEARVQDALARLEVGRTTLVIAHRLATVRAADHIYVLEQGRVVEEGRDADLAARPDGLYAKLRALQFEA